LQLSSAFGADELLTGQLWRKVERRMARAAGSGVATLPDAR
jgi:hypothetical protein